ncbi:hypothetical protein CHU92_00610 [Flavobacterium cyanobacteriorum]|uniref:Lipoprotein n=1 Tax=Flavobacterium cyanobacteriorum TaxID=2022802 RepID=A0A256A4R5_9FLAO|nr:hypothetical protein [Flavobacterium cyanobacteriorum]OYQ48662.1 hypothetical protein CHU92_00610 [Flavobacterium cyanobacteriorum]
MSHLKQLLFLPLIFSGLSSCKQESNLKLTVQNQYIKFVDSSLVEDTYSYRNEAARKNATNVITYTIHNPTDKKYVLILDREYLYPHIYEGAIRSGSIGYFIKYKDSIMKPLPGIIDTLEPPVNDCRNCILQQQVEHYIKLGLTKNYSFKADEYLRNAVTIFPGESRSFKVITMLPVILERNENGGGILRYIHLKDNNDFQLVYYCNASELKKELPKYLIDELKHNHVEIFDGFLKSDPIPLKKLK